MGEASLRRLLAGSLLLKDIARTPQAFSARGVASEILSPSAL
jgi:hypothetical protein